MHVPGLGPSADYLGLRTAFYVGAPLGTPPVFDGNDLWPVDASSLLVPDDVGQPRFSFVDSYVNDNVLVAAPRGDVELRLGLFDDGAIVLDIHQAVVTMALDPSRGGATNGTIAGVLDVEEHIAEFTKLAGAIDPSLCSGATLESIANQLRSAADILADGTQAPGQTCNGISIGLGFTASVVQLGPAVPSPPPPPDPCF